ncbi:MAG: hypothetical protein AAGF46_12840, partial [Pseudomonadota bacterium]
MTQKSFSLGLGAPKCGTTWLYHYIKELPVSNLGCRKEYRIWNAYYKHSKLKERFHFRRLERLSELDPQLSEEVAEVIGQCAECHSFNSQEYRIGPPLTRVHG